MKLTLSDFLERVKQARETIDELFRHPDAPGRRASKLAEMLRMLWPPAPLHACLPHGVEAPPGCVLDEAGKERPEWAALLRPEELSLPQEMGIARHHLVWESIGFFRFHGAFAVAVPNKMPADKHATLRTLLQTATAVLGERLDMEYYLRQQASLVEEVAANRVLADVAEVASPVAHEINNFLNALLLNIAVLELKMKPEQCQGMADIRHQGKAIAALVQQWQAYRRLAPAESQTADLNGVIQEAVEYWVHSPAAAVWLHLTPEPVPVPGAGADLKRVCVFLLRNAVAATPAGGAVAVYTERDGERVVLRVQDSGPGVAPEKLAEFFDPYPTQREGTCGLELAACKTLVRRLNGKIFAENGAEGGVTVTVELPAVNSKSP